MAMKFLKSPWVAGGFLLLTLIPLLNEGYGVINVVRWNDKIASGQLESGLLGSVPPEVELARANALATQGKMEQALSQFKVIEENAQHPFSGDAGYNAATLYLRKAVEGGGPQGNPQVIPLVELAKEGLRTVLRKNPEDWDARYNLDRALRLIPENEDDDNEGGAPPIGAERAPTTMRGFTLGLP
jgi:mxaK protein